MKTLNDAVDFYHSLERFGINPGLGRIDALCEVLGRPEKKLRCVHIAGTNGKGSVCAEIASVLKAAGHKTGLYVSPYVLEFRERMQINGEMIPENTLIKITSAVKEAVSKLNEEGIYPTEFEAVTAAAFKFFADEKCDVVVLETGLGGRFDATNIITEPVVSVITSISLDHTGILGNSLGEIAAEKCGIIKNKCYTVTPADQPEEALAVIRDSAENKNSILFEADKETLFETLSSDITGTVIKYRDTEIKLPFAGEHQRQNFAVALKAIEVIGVSGIDITVKQIKEGIENAFIPARTEILCSSPLIILDGSHNDGSTAALGEYIKNYLPDKKVLAVMGMMADKDCKKAISNLSGCFAHIIAVSPSNPRAMKADTFCAMLTESGFSAEYISDPVKAVNSAFEALENYDALVVCGSLYLAADVRESIIKKIKEVY
ncbi:MAG: bifunctional folylpolyglutamate synthase/dihydrofolate synthase [Oscillospiraceae bacterium]|nr:bifunctional folylpolyglutamate synthase/dihydrofolate synthase [Oscillospiraceae bacterium]